ncbi:MAG: alkaline phosphatase family protein [Solirubrobacteraceae bacterium]
MRALRLALRWIGATVVCLAFAAPAAAAPKLPGGSHQVRHVFVIVLENESEATSFGAATPAPYLAKTMTSQGAFLPNYYGVGHSSLDNYIAMVSGQAPNPSTQADCGIYADFPPGGSPGSYGQQPGSGCIYPAGIPSIATQLDGAGLSWRDYNESMGADPSREASVCGHPPVGSPDSTEVATSTDTYATRHNPFMYFHSIIDNASLCDSHVVNLDKLPGDLRRVSGTRDYTFITPDLCSDGHDTPCPAGGPGGLAQVNTFLTQWVPRITRSPAFRRDGLLVVTFDEAEGDSTSCCGEIPGPAAPLPGGNGPGGGKVGAVLLSPCIKPGTVSQAAYNHYSMLGSVENLFGLSHLGYAALPGETYFGSDVLKRQCGPSPPRARLRASIASAGGGRRARVKLRWSSSTRGGTALAYYQLQVRRGHGWQTLLRRTQRTAYSFTGTIPHVWKLRARAVNLAGQASRWSTATAGAVS